MIPLVRHWVADAVAALDPPDPVVEFGALQVEAEQDADLRPLFAGRQYVGTDLRPGRGVDRVEDLRALTLPDDSVGTALCLETLEHCDDPMAAGRELARVVRDDGVCLVSTPLLLGIHGYPNDFFRYTPEGLAAVLRGFAHVRTAAYGDPGMPSHVFALAAHRPPAVDPQALPSLARAQEAYAAARGQIRIGPFRLAPRELAGVVAGELRRLAAERLRAARGS